MFEINLDSIQALYDNLKKLKTSTRQKSIALNFRSKFLTHHNLIEHIYNKSINLGVPVR